MATQSIVSVPPRRNGAEGSHLAGLSRQSVGRFMCLSPKDRGQNSFFLWMLATAVKRPKEMRVR